MKTQDSYFVRFENGTTAWLAVGKPVPENATIVEVRPILMPDDSMVLRNKETGEESSWRWLNSGDSADKWEETPEPKEE